MTRMKSVTSLVVCLLIVALPLMAADRPFGRIDYAMAYVPFFHAVMMYGGWAPPRWVPTNEAWTWDGATWSRLETSGAPAFAHHTMAFDSKRNLLVICGRPTPHEGSEYQIWEFNGKTWQRRENLPVSASAQGDPKMTYDSHRNRLVLYVALTAGTSAVWEYNGHSWELAKPAHEPMRCDDNGCQWQYDPDLKKSILVGEERTVSPNNPLAWDGREWGMQGGSGTQTWLWDGKDWERVSGEQPPRAVWGGMTFDAARHRLLLVNTRMETWTFTQNNWAKLSPPNSPQPEPNGFFGVAYDPQHKNSLFFGGESRQSQLEKEWTYPETTWIFDGRSWTAK